MNTEEKVKRILQNKDISRYFNHYLTNPPDILTFTEFFFETVNKRKFHVNWHHVHISDKLNQVLKGEHPTNCLIFNIPPRHTKTELAVINFTALGFAINPESEFMHLSSSNELVIRNAMLIRNIMGSPIYNVIFPWCNLTNNAKGYLSTSRGGVFYTAPFLGQITGFGCGKLGSDKFAGAMLIDDPMKTQDALSTTMREKVNFTWANTLISRRNDQRTPVIVTAQRVHEKDFCGFLIEEEGIMNADGSGGKWDVITIPAINEEDGVEKALWTFRLSLDALKKQRELDKWVFETQYMQDPKPIEGLLFHESTTRYYNDLPDETGYIQIGIDPADEGNDYLCSVVYKVLNDNVYILDVIYTQDNSNVTIPRIMQQIKQFSPSVIRTEANGAGMFFANTIKQNIYNMQLNTMPRTYKSSQNKEIRILEQAPYINNKFYYPANPTDSEMQLYLKHKHSYLKMIKNQKDDGVDTDAATCEYLRVQNIISRI